MPNNFISQQVAASGLVVDVNTLLLMQFEGANGSTVFVDDVGHVITKGGNPIIETNVVLSGNSSGQFDGVADYLSVPGTDFTFTGDFTIEFDFQLISYPGSARSIFGNYTTNAGGNWMFAIIGTTSPIWYVNGAGTYVQIFRNLTIGQKYRVALVRKNGVCSVYMDGIDQGGSVAYAGVFGLSTLPLVVAKGQGPFGFGNMYFDKLRISNVARYSANYAP